MEGASVKPAIEAIALCLAEKTVFTLEGIPSYRAHEKSFSFRIGDFANVKIWDIACFIYENRPTGADHSP